MVLFQFKPHRARTKSRSTRTYQYKPLKKPHAEIRLALIQPGAYGDEICISFQTRKLKVNCSGGTHKLTDDGPEYEALSYAWGSKDDPSYVRVGTSDGACITITRNLDVALRQLRYEKEYKHRVMWIDALCIDQCSTTEKEKQVAVMGTVFSKARCVILWVGPAQDKSDDALKLIQYLGDRVDYDWRNRVMRPSSQCSGDDFHWSDEAIPLPYQSCELSPVLALFERPYFARTWIRQEIALARHAVMCCGPHTLSWESFRNAAVCLYLKPRYTGCIQEDRWIDYGRVIMSLYQLCRLEPGTAYYSSLLYSFGDTECEDPRDKIYAALALMNETDRQLDIEPNYSQGVKELYAEVARRVLIQQRTLELLESCSLSARVMDIPSWVPDWSAPLPQTTAQWTNWSACGWISSQASVLNERLICVAGITVSRVEVVAALDMGVLDVERDTKLSRILKSFKPTPEQSATKHTTERRWAETFCRAYLIAYLAEAYYPQRTYLLRLEQCVDALELVWSSVAQWDKLELEARLMLEKFLNRCTDCIIGRCFFKLANGHVGLGVPGIEKDDIVCVLLGSKFPVVLRSIPGSNSKQTWEVVGTCCVTGLMNGELVYGDKLPPHYQAVNYDEASNQTQARIDNGTQAFYDSETDTLKTDPAELLTQMGIKVERYQRWPHFLEVLPETLRAAGIPLEDFILA